MDLLSRFGSGFVRFVPNSELDTIAAKARQTAQPLPITNLAAFVLKCWESAKNHKNASITPRLVAAQLARVGKYDSAKLAQIHKFGGSDEYARVTANKCRIAEAWIRDVYLGQSDKPWTLAPTPVPELPQDTVTRIRQQVAQEYAIAYATTGQPVEHLMIQQRINELTDAEQERARDVARSSAANMEELIYDQLLQGGWVRAMAEFIADLVTYPSSILKGPVFRKKKTMKWSGTAGNWQPNMSESIVPEFERVDPFKIFPSPNASCPQDGFIIELITLSRGDLYDLIEVEGYSEPAIRAVLDEYSKGGLVDWTNQVQTSMQSLATGEPTRYASETNVTIDAIEYHGPIQGQQLIDWGVNASEVEDPQKDYEACVWLIGRWVIKASLNYDIVGRRPYYKASYEDTPGSFWGNGIPDILSDVQAITNAATRAMVNNAAFSAGPMIGVNTERLAVGETLTKMEPLQVFQFEESRTGSSLRPIDFFQPESRVSELSNVIQQAYAFADDFSLIPRVMHGSNIGTVGRTASGTSMVLDAANKGLKGVVSSVDVNVITPLLETMFNFNMQYSDDQSVKGDAKIVARGAVSLMQLDSIQLRRNEFLQITNNPTDTQIVGLEGRAEILREAVKGLDMDAGRIIPPRGTLSGASAQMAAQQPQLPQSISASGETLSNGAPVTDNFSPTNMT